MNRSILILLVTTLIISSLNVSTVNARESSTKNIVGYFTEWSIYDSHNNYEVSDIPWDKVTHINYAFAKIEDGKIAIIDKWAATDKPFGDDKWDTPLKGNLGQLIKYKKLYPNVKTLISVGGWTQSMHFSDVAFSDSARNTFADSCVEFIRKYSFDGVDIDWEFPGGGGMAGNKSRPEDKQNFTLLLKSLREKLDLASENDNKKYLLTIAAPAGFSMITNTEPDKYYKYLDFINLMTYDFNGTWNEITNHLAPLYSNPHDPSTTAKKEKSNADWVIKEYIKLGVPAIKLNLGVPYYSLGWKDVAGSLDGLFGKPSGSPVGLWNDASEPSGTNPYYHISDILEAKGSGFTKYWDKDSMAAYLWNPTTNEFYSYEDDTSLKNKCDYVLDNKLGGIMFWEFAGDNSAKDNTLTSIIYDTFNASQLYKISGFIKPDINFSENDKNKVLSGFKVEISELGIIGISDENGYFEVTSESDLSQLTITINKDGYLERQIKNLNKNSQIGSEASPVIIWAGDIKTNGLGDKTINMQDVIEIAKAFNSISGDSKYNTQCDFNMDNSINMSDVIIIAKNFNKTSNAYPEL